MTLLLLLISTNLWSHDLTSFSKRIFWQWPWHHKWLWEFAISQANASLSAITLQLPQWPAQYLFVNSEYFSCNAAAVTYISNLKVLPHEQVEWSAGVSTDIRQHWTAMSQQSQAQIGALLCVVLKQQLRKLSHITSLPATQYKVSK